MSTALVTGAAGFIGSTLVDRLLADGWRVIGIDSFTPYYDRAIKERNVHRARQDRRFELIRADVGTTDLAGVLRGVDVVFHQGAQPGVRGSWADGFGVYLDNNVRATQRLLEAAVTAKVTRFVYASSSSVYGNAAAYPTSTADLPRPHSPYGVTKLAGEHLCNLYAANHDLPTVSLRYFTVYGPRQRPDMATHRLVEAALTGKSFPLFGDGSHIRDFTYVDDVVAANIAAAEAGAAPGTVVNVAGGSSCTMAELIELVGELCGALVHLDRRPEEPGDVQRTGGAIDTTAALLGWRPMVDLATGVAAQVAWHRANRPILAPAAR